MKITISELKKMISEILKETYDKTPLWDDIAPDQWDFYELSNKTDSSFRERSRKTIQPFTLNFTLESGKVSAKGRVELEPQISYQHWRQTGEAGNSSTFTILQLFLNGAPISFEELLKTENEKLQQLGEDPLTTIDFKQIVYNELSNY